MSLKNSTSPPSTCSELQRPTALGGKEDHFISIIIQECKKYMDLKVLNELNISLFFSVIIDR